ICGYWRITSLLKAWKPSRMISRLTTVARTGRRMNGSVKAIADSLASGLLPSAGLVVPGQRLVVDDGHMGAVVQLELAGGHHALAGGEALEHQLHAVAALAGLDETALDHQARLALVVLDHGALVVLLLADH